MTLHFIHFFYVLSFEKYHQSIFLFYSFSTIFFFLLLFTVIFASVQPFCCGYFCSFIYFYVPMKKCRFCKNSKEKCWFSSCLLAERTYSASNWTVPTLPSTSRDLFSRRLRSTTQSAEAILGEGCRRIGSKKYLCLDCRSTFALKASLVRHQYLECTKTPPPPKRRSEPRSSSEAKHGGSKKHDCANCGRTYAFYTSLWRHQHYECGMEPKFDCTICQIKFAQKSNLDRHMRNRH